MKAGTPIGTFTAFDEDTKQTLTYSLLDDDQGRFKLVGNQLQKALPANYETKNSHKITLLVKDDGNPSMSVSCFLVCFFVLFFFVFSSFFEQGDFRFWMWFVEQKGEMTSCKYQLQWYTSNWKGAVIDYRSLIIEYIPERPISKCQQLEIQSATAVGPWLLDLNLWYWPMHQPSWSRHIPKWIFKISTVVYFFVSPLSILQAKKSMYMFTSYALFVDRSRRTSPLRFWM